MTNRPSIKSRYRTVDDLIEAAERRTALYTVLRLPSRLSTQEFAAESGMTAVAVRKACQRGTIRADRIGGAWRIPRTEVLPYVEEWIRKCSLETLEQMKSRSGRIA